MSAPMASPSCSVHCDPVEPTKPANGWFRWASPKTMSEMRWNGLVTTREAPSCLRFDDGRFGSVLPWRQIALASGTLACVWVYTTCFPDHRSRDRARSRLSKVWTLARCSLRIPCRLHSLVRNGPDYEEMHRDLPRIPRPTLPGSGTEWKRRCSGQWRSGFARPRRTNRVHHRAAGSLSSENLRAMRHGVTLYAVSCP